MSWVEQRKNNYVLVASVSGEINPNNLEIISFTVHDGNNGELKQFIDLFLNEIDNDELVTIDIVEEECGERIYGSPRPFDFFVEIGVHKDDVEKKDGDSRVRISVKTNVFPSDRDAFVQFFKDLSEILSW